jgi:predicted transcriptional regulator
VDQLGSEGEAAKPEALDLSSQLGKREREIMEIVYRRGRASASDVRSDLAEAPSYSSVRAMLRYLEDKGHLRHEQDGPRYVYLPTAPIMQVRKSALRHVVRNFFNGSVTTAVATLLESKDLSQVDYERLSSLLERARPEQEDE